MRFNSRRSRKRLLEAPSRRAASILRGCTMSCKRYIPTVLAAAVVMAACGDDDGSGNGSTSGAAATPEDVCRGARANIARCRGTEPTDQAACRAQCVKELAGEGVLARDVAEIVFQGLTSSLDAECLPTSLDPGCLAKSAEEKCAIFKDPDGWGFGPFPPHSYASAGRSTIAWRRIRSSSSARRSERGFATAIQSFFRSA